MKHVGMFEAKTNLSSLVEEVEKGGEVVITRHGKPVAKLVAAANTLTAEQIARQKQAMAELREMARKRGGPPISHEEIKSWIEDGRH
jgi:prevent-host-death family protein